MITFIQVLHFSTQLVILRTLSSKAQQIKNIKKTQSEQSLSKKSILKLMNQYCGTHSAYIIFKFEIIGYFNLSESIMFSIKV